MRRWGAAAGGPRPLITIGDEALAKHNALGSESFTSAFTAHDDVFATDAAYVEWLYTKCVVGTAWDRARRRRRAVNVRGAGRRRISPSRARVGERFASSRWGPEVWMDEIWFGSLRFDCIDASPPLFRWDLASSEHAHGAAVFRLDGLLTQSAQLVQVSKILMTYGTSGSRR